jgi:hypothetical protein
MTTFPTEQLLPGAASYETQQELATAVLRDVRALPQERAHAKCWATYRCMEGKLPFERWEREVQPVVIEQIEDATQWVRWVTSLRTAEFYLCGLQRDVWEMPWGEEDELGEWLRLHPSFVINYLRVECVMAYRALLLGYDEECRQRVIYAMQTGLRQAGRVAFDTNPLRVLEMRDDWHAYVTLLIIGQKLGCVAECHAPWANAAMIERDDGHLPYVKCLKKLGENARPERRIW